MLALSGRTGARLASLLRVAIQQIAISSMLGLAFSGCLVTDKISFPTEPNIPPRITSVPGMPSINSIIWIDKVHLPSLKMAVSIDYQNTSRTLTARWRLVKASDETPKFEQRDVLPTADAKTTRELTFDVQSELLTANTCHHLELAISSEFYKPAPDSNPKYFRDVNVDIDLAEASWWIWEGLGQAQTSAQDKATIAGSCPDTNEDLLPKKMPTAQSMGTGQ